MRESGIRERSTGPDTEDLSIRLIEYISSKDGVEWVTMEVSVSRKKMLAADHAKQANM